MPEKLPMIRAEHLDATKDLQASLAATLALKVVPPGAGRSMSEA
jgi:hypothetical protein